MNETKPSSEAPMTKDDEKNSSSTSQENGPNIVTKITLYVLAACFFFLVWYLFTDRLAPFTDRARIQGLTIPVAAAVSGRITDITVENGQIVEKGTLLVQIDPRRYQAKLDKALADLRAAEQDVGSATAEIASARANLADAEANLRATIAENTRILKLVQQGIYAKGRADIARGEIDQAKAKVNVAQSKLDEVIKSLGQSGRENTRIKAAVSLFESARLDLADTSIYAPVKGVVQNINIEKGHYARVGDPLLAFISAEDVWVEAYMRENSLAHLKKGDTAELTLDVAPGEVFKGEVMSVGYGVQWDQNSRQGELQNIKLDSNWLRDAQRFPVLIRFKDDSARKYYRLGGQVDVIIFTGDHMILNLLGKFWIRLNAYLSYLY